MKKELLALIKLYPNDINPIFFYSDGTYRTSEWEPGEYSRWRIDGGALQFQHAFDTEADQWVDFVSSESEAWITPRDIAAQLRMAMDDKAEKELLDL